MADLVAPRPHSRIRLSTPLNGLWTGFIIIALILVLLLLPVFKSSDVN